MGEDNTAMICDTCEQEMTAAVSCAEIPYWFHDYPFDRIRATEDCHDCSTPAGGLHHPGCDVERCPWCGGQYISCGCQDASDEDDEA